MRKLIIIPILFISLIVSATTYYVSPTGNDAAAGAIGTPWKTWGKAFNATEVMPGDIVYFRGGTYTKNLAEGQDGWYYPARSAQGTGYNISRDGTAGNYIHYFAYPGETPILDCYNAYHATQRLCWGVYASGVNYVHFKGLILTRVRQIAGRDMAAFGWQVNGNNVIFENCKAHHIWGVGFRCGTGAGQTINFINCDAYNCCDSLSAALPGNDGYGFSVIESAGNSYFTHCRAWLCGDDGFNAGILYTELQTQYTEYDGCWSFRNGMLQGGGTGFKMGWISYTDGNLKRLYKNCIGTYNRWNGWKTNDFASGTKAIYCHAYNNIAYHNGWQGGVEYASGGFEIHNVPSDDANETLRILKNNISYANEGYAVWNASGGQYTHQYNSWDSPPGVTITTSDFISLDSTGITAARQANGSLPNNDCYNKFLKLSVTSQAKWAGTNLGITYDADSVLWHVPPSIGFKEYAEQGDPEPPLVLSDVVTFRPYWQTETTAISGGNVYDAGGGTVSARGVCWNTTGSPTIAGSHTTDGTGTGIYYSTMTGLSQGSPYYVRAYATNEIGTAYGNQMTFRASQILMIGTKILRTQDGKVLIID